jgi:tRNA(His) guanylyltransferase
MTDVRKMASVSASMFTAVFNQIWQATATESSQISSLAMFDSRVFVIPNRTDVENYFIWRQADATRNSLNMLASCYYSHGELHGKGSSDKHEMLFAKGVNWNDCPTNFKRGRIVRKTEQERTVSYTHKKTQQVITTPIQESVWVVDNEIPVFTGDRDYLNDLIPLHQ